MTRSSVKIEYHAMTLATCDLMWIKALIQEKKILEIS